MDLGQLRDFLLPGLWSLQQNIEKPLVRQLDLYCNYPDGTLELSIDGQRQPLLCREEIQDGSYLRNFAPRVRQLLTGEENGEDQGRQGQG